MGFSLFPTTTKIHIWHISFRLAIYDLSNVSLLDEKHAVPIP